MKGDEKVTEYKYQRNISGTIRGAEVTILGVGYVSRFRGFGEEWQTNIGPSCRAFRSLCEIEAWVQKLEQLIQIAKQMEQDPKLNDQQEEATK